MSMTNEEDNDIILAAAIEASERRQDEKRQKEFLSLMAALDTKLDPLIKSVQAHDAILTAAMQQQQAPPAAPPQQQEVVRRRINPGEIVQQIEPLLELGYKTGYLKRPDEMGTLDKLATIVRNRYEKKVAIAAEKDIKKWLKAGDIDEADVSGLIPDVGNHNPA